jgi:CheY-like chemotaxis protein/Tfp pilus assembly protein PilZ
MSADPSQSRLRVLIVDEEAVVRDLLAEELSAAGYEVDTLSSGTGFSEDMVRLIHPDLLLVDPFLKDVSLEAVVRVLAALHVEGSFKLVLIDSGEDPGRFSKIVAACHAEGAISKRELLRAPADAVAEQFLPEAEVMEILEDGPKLQNAVSAAEEGIEIQLTVEPPKPRPAHRPPVSRSGLSQRASGSRAMKAVVPALPEPPAPRRPGGSRAPPPPPADAAELPGDFFGLSAPASPAPPPRAAPPAASARPPRASASGGNVLSMIQQEVGNVPKAPAPAAKKFIVEVNLFSRNNFYVGPSGDLRTGGVFVATATLPRVGDQVQLQIQLISMPPLDTEGVVEWVRKSNQLGRVNSGAGVSLAHLPDDWRATLEVFFGERSPLTFLPADVI